MKQQTNFNHLMTFFMHSIYHNWMENFNNFSHFLSSGPLLLLSFFIVVFLLSVFFLTSFSLFPLFCHFFFYIHLPSFTAYFNLSFCSYPLPSSGNHFAIFRNRINERYQIFWTSNRHFCRNTSPLQSPWLYSTLQTEYGHPRHKQHCKWRHSTSIWQRTATEIILRKF